MCILRWCIFLFIWNVRKSCIDISLCEGDDIGESICIVCYDMVGEYTCCCGLLVCAYMMKMMNWCECINASIGVKLVSCLCEHMHCCWVICSCIHNFGDDGFYIHYFGDDGFLYPILGMMMLCWHLRRRPIFWWDRYRMHIDVVSRIISCRVMSPSCEYIWMVDELCHNWMCDLVKFSECCDYVDWCICALEDFVDVCE